MMRRNFITTKDTIQNAVSATGNGSVFDCAGLNSLGIEVAGTFTATVTFQMRVSGGTWTAVNARNMNTSKAATTTTATGLFQIECAGFSEFRAPVTWTSGTSVTVTVQGSTAEAQNPAAVDGGPLWAAVWGLSNARFTSADASSAATAITDAPTSGQKIVLVDLIISVDTAMTVDITEETSGTNVLEFFMPANGTAQITPRIPIKLATADKQAMVQTSASGNISITATYYSEA